MGIPDILYLNTLPRPVFIAKCQVSLLVYDIIHLGSAEMDWKLWPIWRATALQDKRLPFYFCAKSGVALGHCDNGVML